MDADRQDRAETIARAIRQGRGAEPADLVIKNVGLLDLIDGAVDASDIAICGDRIVGTHETYSGAREIDGTGLFAVPGLIDTHLHIESSLVTPAEFERCVLPRGVTTAICDPHEIANVLGASGIRYFLDHAGAAVMDIRVNLSSCVPATPFETAGASLSVEDLLALRDHPKVLGLAEMMNYPGVLSGDGDVLAKLAAFADGHIDGHAPLLRGPDLNGYLAAGIRTDHETTTAAEAREKLKKGLAILIREGSVSKDMRALAEILDANSSSSLAFCTDDRNPLDIAEEGHIDHIVRTLIALGRPLHHVYRSATRSAAEIFGLKDRGVIAPGRRADILLMPDLETCRAEIVVSAGRIVDAALFETRRPVPPVGLGSVKAKPVEAAQFAATAGGGETPVIGVVPGLIITEKRMLRVPSSGGEGRIDTATDILKVAVVERHGKTDRGMATGFVQGFGLKRGAIASSVAHDSHNIVVVGASEEDMAAAVNHLIAIGGGFAVADGGAVLADLPLPIAGLMSEEPFEVVHDALVGLRAAAKSLGCTLPEPFLQVAFLALPVIPHLKMTDRGLFDVDRFAHVTG